MSSAATDVSNLTTSFNTSASTYDRRTGGSTRAVAAHLLTLLPPLPASVLIHDNCCGIGQVADELLKLHPDIRIRATDISQNMIDIVNSQIQTRGWEGKVSAAVMDGQDLKFEEGVFDISVTNYGIFFFPDPVKGAREIWRTLKLGGTAVVTAWEFIGFLPVFWEVQRIIRPAREVSAPTLTEWTRREKLEGVLREGGFGEGRMERKEVLMGHETVEALVVGLLDLFLGLVGEEWSAEEKGRMREVTEGVLREDGGRFLVREGGRMGVRMVAWIAVVRK
ncbi:hypothetical protein MMC30_006184 [Trapelia coarctata]|nr:hypothetical protein [Trapelia coarctata]